MPRYLAEAKSARSEVEYVRRFEVAPESSTGLRIAVVSPRSWTAAPELEALPPKPSSAVGRVGVEIGCSPVPEFPGIRVGEGCSGGEFRDSSCPLVPGSSPAGGRRRTGCQDPGVYSPVRIGRNPSWRRPIRSDRLWSLPLSGVDKLCSVIIIEELRDFFFFWGSYREE